MNVRSLLKTKGTAVYTVKSDMVLKEAVALLCEKRVGALPVEDSGGRLTGMLSERDIICASAKGVDIRTTRVSEIMTRDVIIILGGDDIDNAMNIMTEKKIRHLPVVEEGKIQGIISIGDVVNALRSDKEAEVQHLTDYITGVAKG